MCPETIGYMRESSGQYDGRLASFIQMTDAPRRYVSPSVYRTYTY